MTYVRTSLLRKPRARFLTIVIGDGRLWLTRSAERKKRTLVSSSSIEVWRMMLKSMLRMDHAKMRARRSVLLREAFFNGSAEDWRALNDSANPGRAASKVRKAREGRM